VSSACVRASVSRPSTSAIDRTFGQRVRALRVLPRRGRIVATFSFGIEKPVKLAHRRQPPRQRGSRQAAFGDAHQKSAQVIGGRFGDADFAARRWTSRSSRSLR